MKKEITITNANNQEKFICFRIEGLEDGIMVGLYPNGDGLSIAYKGDVVGVPFNANSALIDELNDNSFPSKDEIENNRLYDPNWKLDNHNIIDSKLSGPVNAISYPLKTEWEIKADDKITTDISNEVITITDKDLEKIKNIDISNLFKVGTAEDIYDEVYGKDDK